MIERKRLKRQRSNGIAMSSAGRGPDRPLIDSILLAAGAVGDPRKGGTGGVIGYLKWLASADPRTYATLLGRVLPLQRIVEDNTGNDNSKGTERYFTLLIALADRLAEDHVPQSPAEGFALGLRMFIRAHPAYAARAYPYARTIVKGALRDVLSERGAA
jgi:hypothetical protein